LKNHEKRSYRAFTKTESLRIMDKKPRPHVPAIRMSKILWGNTLYLLGVYDVPSLYKSYLTPFPT